MSAQNHQRIIPSPFAVGGRLHWLIDPHRGTLLPLTGLWILGLDWLLFSSNVMSAGLATPLIVILGFFIGGYGAIFLQTRIAHDPLWKAVLKGLGAGIAVGVPWPIMGTLVGGWVLLASGIKQPTRDTLRKR